MLGILLYQLKSKLDFASEKIITSLKSNTFVCPHSPTAEDTEDGGKDEEKNGNCSSNRDDDHPVLSGECSIKHLD